MILSIHYKVHLKLTFDLIYAIKLFEKNRVQNFFGGNWYCYTRKFRKSFVNWNRTHAPEKKLSSTEIFLVNSFNFHCRLAPNIFLSGVEVIAIWAWKRTNFLCWWNSAQTSYSRSDEVTIFFFPRVVHWEMRYIKTIIVLMILKSDFCPGWYKMLAPPLLYNEFYPKYPYNRGAVPDWVRCRIMAHECVSCYVSML